MPQSIENVATLRYNYGNVSGAEAVSNVATASIQGQLTVNKNALDSSYSRGDELTYIISVTNSGSTAISNVTVTDNLGTFTPAGGAPRTPLSYIGPAELYINGIPTATSLIVDSDEEGEVVFTVTSLPAGANAIIAYKVEVNEFADLSSGSAITNSATVEADNACESDSDEETLPVAEAAEIEIVKSMSPDPVACGDTITYTITLTNYGNLPATNVQLIDNLDPLPENIRVFVDGVETTDFSVSDDGTLTLPTNTTEDTVIPAATFTVDPETGEVTVVPSTIVVTITGTL